VVKEKSGKVREAYLAVTDSEVQKQSIRDMDDRQVVTSAMNHCGTLIMLATDAKVAADKKQKG
jgi:hypothetical protein